MNLEEIRFHNQWCPRIVSGKIRLFIITSFKTTVSVIAVLIMLYAWAEVV